MTRKTQRVKECKQRNSNFITRHIQLENFDSPIVHFEEEARCGVAELVGDVLESNDEIIVIGRLQ